MEKTLISFNVPNFVSINLMAWVGLLLFVILWQFVGKKAGKLGGGSVTDTGDGY